MLDEIVQSTRGRLKRDGVVTRGDSPPRRAFAASLSRPGLQVIAEFKRRSPSAGELNLGMDPVEQALSYEAGGAAAISVLTEPDYFGGSLEDLRNVRQAVFLPVLRKDFIIDPRQVAESRIAGADALLLIIAGLELGLLRELMAECRTVGIEALVEAHNEAEAMVAVAAGAQIIGVNNRDLTTFQTDLAVAERIAPMLPKDRTLIGESGVSAPAGAVRMADAGYDAILVGEALVRSDDPADLIRSLQAASR